MSALPKPKLVEDDEAAARIAAAARAGAEPAKVIQVRATVGPAKMRFRHWGQIASFLVLVLLPFAAAAFYLTERATPQYASTVGFTVRSNEMTMPTDLLGGITQLAAGPANVDGDILHEFIESQTLVERLLERQDLRAHYAQTHERDPIFALAPDATIEDFVSYWQRVVRLSYDQATGLMELQVLAFDPETAHGITQAIIEESQALLNELNAAVRTDSVRYAEDDLAVTTQRLVRAREDLAAFRSRTQIVDPEIDLEGRLGVLTNLQQQLAEVLVEYDLLSANTSNPNDTRLQQMRQRIAAIRARISEERGTFNVVGETGRDEAYSDLMTEYEGLVVARELAETTHGLAVAALDLARTNAARQSRYLAVYIEPSVPDGPEYPRNAMILAQAGLFLLIAWSIIALIVYSIRDRQ
ncbi:sugar transporter [Gymnodinialimonas hymeniacidonis]|uniref:sugar transporter n=1 Tax=Gymnodinialimonas hymeniacidonis TaxID=3126508 RepID=UPI0034C5FDBF